MSLVAPPFLCSWRNAREPLGETPPPAFPDRYTPAIIRRGHLRASDADRDQVAERLRAAATEGRIGFDELEERLGATLAARTYAELEAVVADLPASQPARRRSWLPASPIARVAVALAVAVPVLLAAVFVLTAALSAWMLWAVAGWWFFGHRYGYHHDRYRRRGRRHDGRHHAYDGPRHAHRQAGADPGRGFWT